MLPMLVTGCATEEPSCPSAPAADLDPTRGARRVLLVTLDTTRADHVGASGDGRGLTPALDRFATGALVYARAHAHAPWTKPSVATMFTSRLPMDHGVRQWDDALEPDAVTLATTLHDAGWRTEAVVSHDAFDPADNEFELGFDAFTLSWLAQPESGPPTDVETSTHLTDLAVAALERLQTGSDPFLLWVHYFDPHDVYLHHDDWRDLGDDDVSAYAEEVAWTDLHVGRLLELAEADPELVVAVVGDHGEELRDHGRLGHTRTLYEEVLRVPLLLRAPGLDPGVVETPVGTIDLAPTLLDLCGIAVPASFDGLSLLPAPIARDHLAETSRLWHVRALVRWPWKIVWDLDADSVELYDLCADPGELDDRSEREGEVVERLSPALAEAWRHASRP